jgi:tetratricopeptide (TPR) repeat protein
MKLDLLFFIVLIISVSCQKKYIKNQERALAYYKKGEYAAAIKFYRQLPAKKLSSTSVLNLANAYRLLNSPNDALYWYRNYFSIAASPEEKSYMYLGDVLQKCGNYELAKMEFIKYSGINPIDSLIKIKIISCDSALRWISTRSTYKVINLRKLNSSYSEIAPVSYNDGLIFSSSREGTLIRKKNMSTLEPYYDFYFSSQSSNTKWNHPVAFSSVINSSAHEAACCFNMDQTKIYFTRSTVLKKDTNTVNRLKLFASEKKVGVWLNPEKFIFNDSSNSSYAHPSLSPDGKIFFFASDLPGGYGGTDIYACLNVEGKWTVPINLGPHINTKENEIFPFFHSDRSLYFASNGHVGMGGYDLFKASEVNGEWSLIENLKYPINSSADDFSIYFNLDKSAGYFSSNRSGGLGKEDIYMLLK